MRSINMRMHVCLCVCDVIKPGDDVVQFSVSCGRDAAENAEIASVSVERAHTRAGTHADKLANIV